MKMLVMNKIYELWMVEIQNHFEENRLKFLLSDVEEDVIEFFQSSSKKLTYNSKSFTLSLTSGKDYISYKYVLKNILENEMDSNFLTHSNYSNVEFTFRRSIDEIELPKAIKLLELSQRYEQYFLAFIEWKNIKISEVIFPLGFDECLQVGTYDMEDYYIIRVEDIESAAKTVLKREFDALLSTEMNFDEYLLSQLDERPVNDILGSSKYPDIIFKDFAFYQFDLNDSEKHL